MALPRRPYLLQHVRLQENYFLLARHCLPTTRQTSSASGASQTRTLL